MSLDSLLKSFLPVLLILVKWSAARLGKVVKSPKVVQSTFFCEKNTHSYLPLNFSNWFVTSLHAAGTDLYQSNVETFDRLHPHIWDYWFLQHIHLHTLSQVLNISSQMPNTKLTIPNTKLPSQIPNSLSQIPNAYHQTINSPVQMQIIVVMCAESFSNNFSKNSKFGQIACQTFNSALWDKL